MILLGQSSVRTKFYSGRIVFGHESLCSGKVFIHDSARAEFCSGRVLLGHNSPQAKLCSGISHFARAKCSSMILPRQNCVRAQVTLLWQNVRARFCSGKIVFGLWHSAPVECSGATLLGHNRVRPFGILLGHDSARAGSFSAIWHSARAECLLGHNRVRRFGTLLGQSFPRLENMSEFSTSVFPSEENNALGDVKYQAEDEANPKPWYTADEKSSTMSTEDLLELIRESPLPKVGMLVFLEPTNYGTKFETGIYEEQVKSGQRLLKGGLKSNKGWHSKYFFVGRSDKGKLLFDREWNPYYKDFENPGKLTPNNLTKHILSHINFEKAKGKRKEKQPSAKLPPAPKKTRIVEKVSVDEDLIFYPRWTLCCDDVGMPDSQISKQHLVHGVLPWDKEMYASGSEMLSRFEMARQVATEEAQQKKEAIREPEETTRRAEELSKQETDYLAQIETLERRLEWAKRKVAEEVKKARDQGIRDFLDGNPGDEWLKKRADHGLEIYELGFAKAKEMFAERFPDIPLDDFVLPAVVSHSRETVLPSEAGDAAASHLPGEVAQHHQKHHHHHHHKRLVTGKLKKTCDGTRKHNLCLKLLKYDNLPTTADLSDIVEIAIDLAHSRGKKIRHSFTSFARITNDHQLKKHYLSCSKNYESAVRDIKHAKKHLHWGYYQRIIDEATKASNKVSDCEDHFSGSLVEPSTTFSKKNQEFSFLCNIVAVATEQFAHKISLLT
ncbi:LOW QUALITY PROTEIN: hypothetical protein RJ639_002186 [Escallonia herrerae]|uniref:Pectinesterase inhibitor domain-containing protein n=1 Tax=Escallonia herrerae TaxID=1293975 RepID=A0AA88X943_9ASTE|nr:LOW QUALITY PROTEIN: hypothetical protein RJ639_002186 [Escallonia herrerae]